MRAPRTGSVELVRLAGRLSDRDRAILEDVAKFRLLCARQIGALHFPPEEHASSMSAARCCRRVLRRMTRERLLVRLERRIGGIRAGSAGFVYALGPVGSRFLAAELPRRRLREPSEPFVAHTLAVAQLAVDLMVLARSGEIELLRLQAEPECWRAVPGLGRTILRPDLFVVLGAGELELRWFIEVDRGTSHLPAVLRKSRLYESYFRSGVEQARHGVFPRVQWLTPSARRAERLREAMAADRQTTDALFRVAPIERALPVLTDAEASS